jgi:hypothetical protein
MLAGRNGGNNPGRFVLFPRGVAFPSETSRLNYTSPPMGHLAMRYRDASRSGVYRASDAAIPQAAAAEAGSILTRVAIVPGAAGSALLDALLVDPGPAPRVVIVDGADALAAAHASDLETLVAALQAAAAARRESGVPFYAVLVDPRRVLGLPNLYKEPGAGG